MYSARCQEEGKERSLKGIKKGKRKVEGKKEETKKSVHKCSREKNRPRSENRTTVSFISTFKFLAPSIQ
jgi:hypothetical protein